MIRAFERNRFLVSTTLSVLIMALVTVTLSSFSPPKKSPESFELENTLSLIEDYNIELGNWEISRNALIDLNYWFGLLPRYNEIGKRDRDVLVLQNEIKEKIMRLQLTLLPSIRKFYGQHLAENLKSQKYKVVILPEERNRVIVFTHDSFTNRKSLERFHTSVVTDLRILGFKQIRYRWYELEKLGDEKYIHYNFKDITDHEVRKFNVKMSDS
ncbi:MAG: hypothetical protein ACHQLA_06445 [Ignavibacteriales bacterium]